MPDRVSAYSKGDRDGRRRSFGGDRSKVAAGCGDDGHATTRKVVHESRQAIELALQPMVLDRHVLALDVAGFVEALAEPGNKGRIRQSGIDEADHRHRRLLRARSERPSNRSAAEQRYELASLHSITSSARAMSVGGTSRPSALAVVRFMMRSNLVGCSTGISAGFVPRRILST